MKTTSPVSPSVSVSSSIPVPVHVDLRFHTTVTVPSRAWERCPPRSLRGPKHPGCGLRRRNGSKVRHFEGKTPFVSIFRIPTQWVWGSMLYHVQGVYSRSLLELFQARLFMLRCSQFLQKCCHSKVTYRTPNWGCNTQTPNC